MCPPSWPTRPCQSVRVKKGDNCGSSVRGRAEKKKAESRMGILRGRRVARCVSCRAGGPGETMRRWCWGTRWRLGREGERGAGRGRMSGTCRRGRALSLTPGMAEWPVGWAGAAAVVLALTSISRRCPRSRSLCWSAAYRSVAVCGYAPGSTPWGGEGAVGASFLRREPTAPGDRRGRLSRAEARLESG